MKQTFLRTPGICGMDTFVARLADGCAVTLRLGVARDNLSFDLMASAVEGTPAQSFSLSSVGHLRPLRDVLAAALDTHDTMFGIATGEAPNFGTDHLERKLGEQTNRANQWKEMAEDREKRLDKAQAENERLVKLVSEWQRLAVANDKAHKGANAALVDLSQRLADAQDTINRIQT